MVESSSTSIFQATQAGFRPQSREYFDPNVPRRTFQCPLPFTNLRLHFFIKRIAPAGAALMDFFLPVKLISHYEVVSTFSNVRRLKFLLFFDRSKLFPGPEVSYNFSIFVHTQFLLLVAVVDRMLSLLYRCISTENAWTVQKNTKPCL